MLLCQRKRYSMLKVIYRNDLLYLYSRIIPLEMIKNVIIKEYKPLTHQRLKNRE